MPYSSVSELPANVRSKLKGKKRRQWMHVFNSSYSRHGNESRAFGEAWSTVQKVKNLNFLLPKILLPSVLFFAFPAQSQQYPNSCLPYHLSGGTTASTNSNNIKNTPGVLCDLTPVNTTTTTYYLRLYDAALAPNCTSAVGVKHVFPVPPAAATGGAGGFVREVTYGEWYVNGIGFCVTGGGGDSDSTNAGTGIFIEASFR